MRGITGNEIYGLTGWADTVWMVTARGINFGRDTLRNRSSNDETAGIAWWGYETPRALWSDYLNYSTLASGAGRVLVALQPPRESETNQLWTFNHRARSGREYFTFDLGWDRNNLSFLKDSVRAETFLQTWDIARVDGSFWLACADGGLVRVVPGEIDRNNTPATAFFPGEDSLRFRFAPRGDPFPPEAIAKRYPAYPDTIARVVAVEAGREGDSAAVWVTTPAAVHRFAVRESSWTELSSTSAEKSVSILEFFDLYVRDTPDTVPFILAVASVKQRKDTTTSLLRYRPSSSDSLAEGKWEVVREEAPDDLVFGAGDTVYAVASERVFVYRTSSPANELAVSDDFSDRLFEADPNIDIPSVNALLYVPGGRDSADYLWVATEKGIYFSRDERGDEKEKNAFVRDFRAPPLASGLKRTYLYPSILTTEVKRGFFAYNLSRRAEVTIEIFDWNMDLVTTVIRDAVREAGSKRKAGRSTVEREDYWDGTDRWGTPVSPGVYYYRISTNKGERARGKIIVAR